MDLPFGAAIHNDGDVTAADFKYAWERICNPALEGDIPYHLAAVKGYEEMQAGTATELVGVKAVDDKTLESPCPMATATSSSW